MAAPAPAHQTCEAMKTLRRETAMSMALPGAKELADGQCGSKRSDGYAGSSIGMMSSQWGTGRAGRANVRPIRVLQRGSGVLSESSFKLRLKRPVHFIRPFATFSASEDAQKLHRSGGPLDPASSELTGGRHIPAFRTDHLLRSRPGESFAFVIDQTSARCRGSAAFVRR